MRPGAWICVGPLRIKAGSLDARESFLHRPLREVGAGEPCERCRPMSLFVGTAGWNIPRQLAEGFDSEGTALERYSSRFRAVEVNSSFHRPHKPSTWERWARLVPQDFRFAVKMPKTISHERKLVDCSETVVRFLEQAAC